MDAGHVSATSALFDVFPINVVFVEPFAKDRIEVFARVALLAMGNDIDVISGSGIPNCSQGVVDNPIAVSRVGRCFEVRRPGVPVEPVDVSFAVDIGMLTARCYGGHCSEFGSRG